MLRENLALASRYISSTSGMEQDAVANGALPSIGAAFDGSQTQLDLVAVSYSLGLAGSVLYLGETATETGAQDDADPRRAALDTCVSHRCLRSGESRCLLGLRDVYSDSQPHRSIGREFNYSCGF